MGYWRAMQQDLKYLIEILPRYWSEFIFQEEFHFYALAFWIQ